MEYYRQVNVSFMLDQSLVIYEQEGEEPESPGRKGVVVAVGSGRTTNWKVMQWALCITNYYQSIITDP